MKNYIIYTKIVKYPNNVLFFFQNIFSMKMY